VHQVGNQYINSSNCTFGTSVM